MKRTSDEFWTGSMVVFWTAFVCCALWGSASPSIKIGYTLFHIPSGDTASRILFAGERFMIAGVMVIAYYSLRHRRFMMPQKGNWKYVFALASMQTIMQYVFFYMGLAYTSGVRGSVITAMGTFFSIFISVFVFHFEKLTVNRVLGSIIGFLGVFSIVTAGAEVSHTPITWRGEGAVVAAAVANAISGCLIKLFSRKEDPVILSGWQFFVGGLAMALIGKGMGGSLSPVSYKAWLLLIYMGFISAGAYTLWGLLLEYNDVSRITILGFMNPVMGVLLSAVLLQEGQETFSLRGILSMGLVSLGIILANKKSHP